MISELFDKYYKRLKIEDIDFDEIRELVFEVKKSNLNTTLKLPYIPAKQSKEKAFCYLIYCLDVIEDNGGLDYLSQDIQNFYQYVIDNSENAFLDEIVDFCFEKEQEKFENLKIYGKRKKKFKQKPYYMRDTYRKYNKTLKKRTRYAHAEGSIAGKLDDALFVGGDPEDIAEDCDCTIDRVLGHYKHLRQDLRLNGVRLQEKGICYFVKINDEYYRGVDKIEEA